MKTIAETKRLIIREFSLGDAEYFYHLNKDPEVMRYTGDKSFRSIEESQQLIKNYDAYKKNGFGRNTLILKESNEIIGWCGLKRHEEGMVDLGFRLFQKHWNKGYATEAAKFWISYGLYTLKLHEIHACADNENSASNHLLEKVGFEKMNQYMVNNTLHNWYKIKKK